MMLGLFGKRRFLDAEIEDWQLEVWGKLIRAFGSEVSLASTPVVLPTRDFFPPSDTEGHAFALHVLECVKRHMCISDWPCVLAPQDERITGRQLAAFVFTGGD